MYFGCIKRTALTAIQLIVCLGAFSHGSKADRGGEDFPFRCRAALESTEQVSVQRSDLLLTPQYYAYVGELLGPSVMIPVNVEETMREPDFYTVTGETNDLFMKRRFLAYIAKDDAKPSYYGLKESLSLHENSVFDQPLQTSDLKRIRCFRDR